MGGTAGWGSGSNIYQMVKNSNLAQAGADLAANPSAIFPDLKSQFEVWLGELRPAPPLSVDHDPVDFSVECDPGSDCEIRFEGVLHIGGFLTGSIRSESGTLVTGPGSIEARIDVGTAIINSSGSFNIRARKRVLLRGNVKVSGNICSNHFSIREGAIFEGDCTLLEDLTSPGEPGQLHASDVSQLILAAGAGAE